MISGTGKNPLCVRCDKPIIGVAIYGQGGEGYHPECIIADSSAFHGSCGHFCEACARRDDRIESQQSQIQDLQAKVERYEKFFADIREAAKELDAATVINIAQQAIEDE